MEPTGGPARPAPEREMKTMWNPVKTTLLPALAVIGFGGVLGACGYVDGYEEQVYDH